MTGPDESEGYYDSTDKDYLELSQGRDAKPHGGVWDDEEEENEG